MAMRRSRRTEAVCLLWLSPTLALTPAAPARRPHAARLAAALAGPPQAMETGPRPAVTIEDAGGIDPTPLIDQLRAGDFEAADQTTRDLLIEIAGADATKHGYVYWTEARTLDARGGACHARVHDAPRSSSEVLGSGNRHSADSSVAPAEVPSSPAGATGVGAREVVAF